MNDLIRRRDAVSRMSELLMMELQGQRLPTWNEVYQAMNDIPSAEPEREKGQWVYDTERVMNNGGIYSQYHCSECGFQSVSRMNFCGYCGADMRGM